MNRPIHSIKPMGTLYQRHGIWYCQFNHNKKQYRMSLRTKNIDVAKRKARRVIRLHVGDFDAGKYVSDKRYRPSNPNADWLVILEQCRSTGKENWIGYMFRRALDRSRRRGMIFSLSQDELFEIAARSNGRCEVTGIRFTWDLISGSSTPPYSPTLDRINSADGYLKTNCRLVCRFVNMAMGDWGEVVIHELIEAFRDRK